MAKPFLLDTNILVHLIRQNEVGKRIDKSYALSASLGNALVSIVTVGEMQSLARWLGWGEQSLQKLADLVDEVVTIDINHVDILDRYGEIDAFLVKEGKKIGDNDVWIAATASVADAVLLTTDKDFGPLHGKFIERIWIDPQKPKGGK